MRKTSWIAGALAGALGWAAGSAIAFDIEMTYQGVLKISGSSPLNGPSPVPILFRLHSDPDLEAPVDEVLKPAGSITLEDGVFTTELAFDAGAFDGTQLWMELVVDGLSLLPRQKLTAAPYSLATRGITVDENGQVGIGVEDPEFQLDVNGSIRSGGFRAIGGSNSMSFFNPNGETASFNIGWLNDVPRIRIGGNGAGANGGFDIQRIGDQSMFRVGGDGNIGINEGAPDLRLTIDEQGLGIDDPASQTLGFYTNGLERMRIAPNGFISIGLADPLEPLTVANPSLVDATADAGAARFHYAPDDNNGLPAVQIRRNGPTGGAETNRAEALVVESSGVNGLLVNGGWEFAGRFEANRGNGIEVDLTATSSTDAAILIETDGNAPAPAIYADLNPNYVFTYPNMVVYRWRGDTKVRFDSTGRGYFDGGTQTGGADVAEWFAVEGDVTDFEPGDLLAISTEADRTVTLSTEPYSTLVAGVHATKPGVLLTERAVDDDHSDMVPMGVVGVIPTRVSAENGPIRRGDLLVSSSIPGHAMRGTDHSRMLGAVIGKALEDFDGPGRGVIRVMVTAR